MADLLRVLSSRWKSFNCAVVTFLTPVCVVLIVIWFVDTVFASNQ